jgi:hypothetical protein
VSDHNVIDMVDVDPDERDEIEKVIELARSRGAYLHVEVRLVERSPFGSDPSGFTRV